MTTFINVLLICHNAEFKQFYSGKDKSCQMFFLMKLDGVMCDEVFRAHVYPVISGKLAWNNGMRRKLLMINSHDSFIADFNVPNNCCQISKWGGRRPNNK